MDELNYIYIYTSRLPGFAREGDGGRRREGGWEGREGGREGGWEGGGREGGRKPERSSGFLPPSSTAYI